MMLSNQLVTFLVDFLFLFLIELQLVFFLQSFHLSLQILRLYIFPLFLNLSYHLS